MPSTHKKVIVRKVDRDTINGHVAPSHFVREGKLELLNTSGNVVAIDLTDIKCVFFVREFGDSDSLSRKTFTTSSAVMLRDASLYGSNQMRML